MDISVVKANSIKYMSSIQSADTLFKYTKEMKFLLKTIQRKALVPRYVVENISYLGIDQKLIGIPEKCFCDIKLNYSKVHMNNYGSYGIGFNKRWGIEHGIQPIHYINEKSPACSDFRQAFMSALDIKDEGQKVKNVESELLTHLLYMKPLYNNTTNFHDEKEWRYIPDLSNSEFPQIVPNSHIHSEIADENSILKKFNESLENYEKYWLRFEYEDINHIIVCDESSIKEVCRFIYEMDCDDKTKYGLLTKVINYDCIRGDI